MQDIEKVTQLINKGYQVLATREQIPDDYAPAVDSGAFAAWKSQCINFLETRFSNTAYFRNFYEEVALPFKESVNMGIGILESLKEDIESSSIPLVIPEQKPLDHVCILCNRFHLVARQMRSRHDGRVTLDVQDEYDVQDLFHALLHLYFEDIRPEEWTPSYAGASSRMDFLLKKEQIVIELKKTRKGLGAKEVGEQLIVDIEKYKTHPDCKILLCFVYDPEGIVANPSGIENDLSGDHENLQVVVMIRP